MRPAAPGFGDERPASAARRAREAEGVPPCADLRCGCGSLLARRVDGGVELKCRRCKRTVVLPLGKA